MFIKAASIESALIETASIKTASIKTAAISLASAGMLGLFVGAAAGQPPAAPASHSPAAHSPAANQAPARPDGEQPQAREKNPNQTPEKTAAQTDPQQTAKQELKTERKPSNKVSGKPAGRMPGKPEGKVRDQLAAGGSAAREELAMAFARTHHAELALLLEQTKLANPKDYERAIAELSRTSDRIAQARKANPARAEAELELWKVESRIRVLAARFTMTEDPQLEKELRGLLEERAALRIRALELERQQLAERLEKLDKRLNDARNGGAGIDRDLAGLRRNLPRKPQRAASGQTAPGQSAEKPGASVKSDQKRAASAE